MNIFKIEVVKINSVNLHPNCNLPRVPLLYRQLTGLRPLLMIERLMATFTCSFSFSRGLNKNLKLSSMGEF